MTRLFYLLFLSFVLSHCHKANVEKGTPKCIENKIHEFKTTCCEHGANVKEYTFQGNTVYVFDPGNCGADMSSTVTDSECNTIGMLGGITGNTKVNGVEFSQASFRRTVWQQ